MTFGHIDIVSTLIENGANITAVALNVDNIFVTPLMIAGTTL